MELNGPQKQAVADIVNRAVQHAAAALADLVEGGLALSVPFFDLTSRTTAEARLGDSARARPAVAVRQHFTGAFSGDVLLVFCEQQSLQLVRTLLADAVPLDVMTDLEQDALTEVGNVVLNACLSSLAGQFASRLTSALPHYIRGTVSRLFDGAAPAQRDDALFLHVEVAFQAKEIDGYIVFLMDKSSARRFLHCVDNYLQKA